MKILNPGRHAVGVGLAIFVLAGCGGPQAQVAAPATIPQSAVMPQHSDRSDSRTRGNSGSSGSAFTVSGNYILLNGSKFYVKGMVYSPTPIGNGVSDPPSLDDPLRNGNSKIWSRDLPLMRAMGVNAIHVYNVVPPGHDQNTGPITDWLNAAWNNGTDPIYVLLTIYFDGSALRNKDAARDLAKQYHDMAAEYAKYPSVMGVVISNEIIKPDWWNNGTWWANFNTVADGARAGFAKGGYPKKLVFTSNDDAVIQVGGVDHLADIYYGEKHGAKVDVWGDNPYRGRTFAGIFNQIKLDTTKPVVFTEYGAPASYHPDWANTYFYPRAMRSPGECNPPNRADGPVNRHAAELPESGNPGMDGLIDLVTNNNKLMYDAYTTDGTVSGGFYFEWTDEWWKADGNVPAYRSTHVGNPTFAGNFPGCAYDEAWFGLNGISKGTQQYVDRLQPRPTIDAIKAEWANEQ